ncbi:hypothetical protein ATCC51562_1274 [Campylobacter concisus ATCC 51562]|uniref:Uncharacterized protein n=1 Tax=Campylobacter concisus ATCC 51562 TaxID=1242969 RepID=U2GI28_9BACT|nr:hypothetical protein ATCC51562_1274 [Campylobacter concisus ATCC 51562]
MFLISFCFISYKLSLFLSKSLSYALLKWLTLKFFRNLNAA